MESQSTSVFPKLARKDTATGPVKGRTITLLDYETVVSDELSRAPLMTLDGSPVDSFVGRWHVVRLKTREESSFASDCQMRGVPYFVPMRVVRRHYPDGSRKRLWLALFPGYGFVCADGGILDSARRCRAYQGFLRDTLGPDPHSALSVCVQRQLANDLNWLHRGLLVNPEVIALQNTFPVGRSARVLPGHSMRGFEGPIISHNDRLQLVVQIRFFGDAVPFEFNPADIELID